MSKKRVVLAGGSGFLGRALAKELLARNYEVVVLTRSPRKQTGDIKEVLWDGKNSGEWIQSLDGAEAVVNLAGRNIKCRYTPENLRELTASRVDSVLAIAAAMGHVARPPRLLRQHPPLPVPGGRDSCHHGAERKEVAAADTSRPRKLRKKASIMLHLRHSNRS